jgi:CRISPR system Cascade subunit CasE
MYLSRVFLDGSNRETLMLMSSPHHVHGAVEHCFPFAHTPEGRPRLLWRIDAYSDPNRYGLLLLSQEKPAFDALIDRYGTGQDGETKPYTPLIEKIQSGQRWRFRIKANPVRCIKNGVDVPLDAKRGKICAHVTEEQQRTWLIQRATDSGFDVHDVSVVHTQWHHFKKNKMTVRLRTATFEGVLEVRDAILFQHALIHGIGRAKAYGCGLLTIMRVSTR